MSNGWLLRPGPRAQAKARLFCFPHAGVGASVYRLWPKGLPDDIEVCARVLARMIDNIRQNQI